MTLYPALWKQARALVILKIIFDLNRAVQLKELVSLTQGDDETINKYCNTLATMGLITRVRNHAGYALTAQGFNFINPVNPVNSTENQPLINTTTINNLSNHLKVEEVINKHDSGFYADNLAFYSEIGITLNSHTEFIANHIDPKTVKEEWHKLVLKNKPWPGLLIRILTNLPKPKSKEEREREERRRYATEWTKFNK